MVKSIEWLEEKNTRLRLLAGLGVVVIWLIFSLALLAAWVVGADLDKGGILSLFSVISISFGAILGVHMVTKPGVKQ